MKNYTDGVVIVLDLANSLKFEHKINYIGTEQLLYSILHTQKCYACQYLNDFGATKLNFMAHYKKTLRKSQGDGYTPNALSALKSASEISNKLKLSYVSTEHLLLAILMIDDCRAVSILNALGVDIDGLCAFLKKVFLSNKNKPVYVSEPKKITAKNSERKTVIVSHQNFNEPVFANNKIDKIEPIIENNASNSILKIDENSPLYGLGYDLTSKAKLGQIDKVVGREKELSRLIQTLSRKTKNNPILIGEPGVGKSAIVEGLALKIAEGLVPEFLKNKIVFSLDLGGIVAGTKYRGEFEKKFKSAIDFAISSQNVILFIDEIHNIIGAGSTVDGNMDIAELLKPILARGELSIIGATTFDEYSKHIEKDGALERRFQPINVEEPSVEDAILILNGVKDSFEAHHKIKISDKAIESAVKLSKRYIVDRFLPDKAIDLIDEASSKKRVSLTLNPKTIIDLDSKVKSLIAERDYAVFNNDLQKAKDYDLQIQLITKKIKEEKIKQNSIRSNYIPQVTEEDIKALISEWTKIPLKSLTVEESDGLMSLEDKLNAMVIGQESAVKAVSVAVRRARANLKDPDKPIGSFIFVGPTGVGKTQLAKSLAECVFGDKNSVIRFDMSEYSDKTSINKLIGSPAGYVGYDEDGLLSEKVRRKPYSVVLFDEIEKAHPDVFDLLLQVLDEGRLTDNKGRLINFKNTLIILTSNVGASESENSASLGFGASKSSRKEVVEKALSNHFRLEFINRLDDIVVFNKLEKIHLVKIVKIFLDSFVERVLENGITLKIDDNVYDFIAQKSYTKEYGARQVKRTISKLCENTLSDSIILGEIKSGDKVLLTVENEELKYLKD